MISSGRNNSHFRSILEAQSHEDMLARVDRAVDADEQSTILDELREIRNKKISDCNYDLRLGMSEITARVIANIMKSDGSISKKNTLLIAKVIVKACTERLDRILTEEIDNSAH